MAINPLQKEIMACMKRQANSPVSYSRFPSEPAYRVDEAIKQLYQMGYITALQSKAESHWFADLITPKGQIFLEKEGLI